MDMNKMYGVGITNRYSCFLDNEDLDPLEQLKIADSEKEIKKKGNQTHNNSSSNKGSSGGGAGAEKENRGNKDVVSGGGRDNKEAKDRKVSASHQQHNKQSPHTNKQTTGSSDKDSASDKDHHQHPNSTTTTSSAHPKKRAVDKVSQPQQQNQQANRKGIRDSNAKGNANVKDNKGNENIDRRPPKPPTDRYPNKSQGQGDRPAGNQERPMRFNNEEGREARNNRRNDEARDPEYDTRGGGPRGGGYFRGRGRGGSRGGVQRKREFDRQSGSDKSGVKAVDKRDGAGSRNWGTYKDELEVTTGEVANDSMEEKNTEGVEGAAEGQFEDAENTGEAPADDQPKLMTLDEWKALQQPRAKPVFNLRKPNEGEDHAQWNQMTLKKKEKVEAEEGEEEEENMFQEYDCPQRAGRQKQILDVNFHFADRRGGVGFGGPGRGGRGGRGTGGERGERGGMDRGGRGAGDRDRPGGDRGRGGRNFGRGRGGGSFSREDQRGARQALPKVDDERDFPSLG